MLKIMHQLLFTFTLTNICNSLLKILIIEINSKQENHQDLYPGKVESHGKIVCLVINTKKQKIFKE